MNIGSEQYGVGGRAGGDMQAESSREGRLIGRNVLVVTCKQRAVWERHMQRAKWELCKKSSLGQTAESNVGAGNVTEISVGKQKAAESSRGQCEGRH